MTHKPEQSILDLSTVYFFKQSPPPVIALKDCNLLMNNLNKNETLPVLHGYQSKQDGFMAASHYAIKNRLEYTIIDLQIRLDYKQNRQRMKPEQLASFDYLALDRATRDLKNKLPEILERRLAQEGVDSANLDMSRPDLILNERPELISSVMNEPGWDHLKLLVFQASVPFSDNPLSVGAMPVRHWAAIQEANCRLNPTVRVILDPPV